MIEIEVEAEAWTAALPDVAAVAERAAAAALGPVAGDVVVLLTDDEAVRAAADVPCMHLDGLPFAVSSVAQAVRDLSPMIAAFATA